MFASGLRSVNKSCDSHMLREGEKIIVVNVYYMHGLKEQRRNPCSYHVSDKFTNIANPLASEKVT